MPLAALFPLIALQLSVESSIQDRIVAPGLTFRMERKADPPLNVYGLRFDPKRYRSESVLAKSQVYDLSPANGREVLTKIVASNRAIAGVNGDFFQWGQDPGGDPVNLMLHHGVLLSHPVQGARSLAAAWGDKTRLLVGEHTWEAALTPKGSNPIPIDSLNARGDADQITLHTKTAAFVYGSVPFRCVRIKVGNRTLEAGRPLSGSVVEEAKDSAATQRTPIAPGEVLMTASGTRQPLLAALRKGTRVRIDIKVPTLPARGIREAMGGGPLLIRNGDIVLPSAKNSFNDTRHPRTVIGETKTGERWLVVIDGRQTMSVGASLRETAEIMKAWGCDLALNLDGGGSSSMNLFGLTLNRPSGGVERLIANGVLVYGRAPNPPKAIVKLEISKEIEVGTTATVTLLGASVNDAIFSCQGAAWVDQNGKITAHQPGKATLSVWVKGQVLTATTEAIPARKSG